MKVIRELWNFHVRHWRPTFVMSMSAATCIFVAATVPTGYMVTAMLGMLSAYAGWQAFTVLVQEAVREFADRAGCPQVPQSDC